MILGRKTCVDFHKISWGERNVVGLDPLISLEICGLSSRRSYLSTHNKNKSFD